MKVSRVAVSNVDIHDDIIASASAITLGGVGNEVLLDGQVNDDASPVTLDYVATHQSSSWNNKTLVDPIFSDGGSTLHINTSNAVITIPNITSSTPIVLKENNTSLTNKTFASNTNDIRSTSFDASGSTLTVSGTPSNSNLVATSTTTATWSKFDHNNLTDVSGTLTHAQIDSAYNVCTTKGDLMIKGSSGMTKISAGSNGDVLAADTPAFQSSNIYSIINFTGSIEYILQSYSGSILTFTLTDHAFLKLSADSSVQTGSKFFIINLTPQFQLFLKLDNNVRVNANENGSRRLLGPYTVLYKTDTTRWTIHSLNNQVSNIDVNIHSITASAPAATPRMYAMTLNMDTILIIFKNDQDYIKSVAYTVSTQSSAGDFQVISFGSNVWFRPFTMNGSVYMFLLKDGVLRFESTSTPNGWSDSAIYASLTTVTTRVVISEALVLTNARPAIVLMDNGDHILVVRATTDLSTWTNTILTTNLTPQSVHLLYNNNVVFFVAHTGNGNLYHMASNATASSWPASNSYVTSTLSLTEPCRYTSVLTDDPADDIRLVCADANNSVSIIYYHTVDDRFYCTTTYAPQLFTCAGYLNAPRVYNGSIWWIDHMGTYGKSQDNTMLCEWPNPKYDVFKSYSAAGSTAYSYNACVLYHNNTYYAFRMANGSATIQICKNANLA